MAQKPKEGKDSPSTQSASTYSKSTAGSDAEESSEDSEEESSKDSEESGKEGSSSEESSSETTCSTDSPGSSTKSKSKQLSGDTKNIATAQETSSGTTIYIGEGSVFWRSNGILTIRFDSPQTIRLIDVTKCYVSEINDRSVPSFKSPQLVTNINFDGNIMQENFNILVKALVNLKYLGIHLSSLATLDFNRKGSFDFPNLENLNISGIGFTEDHARVSDMNLVVDNCNAILRFQFPKIIYLSISCPMVICREQELTENILNFLIRHKGSIKFLNLESLFKMGSAFYSGTIDECLQDEEDPDFPPVEYDLSRIKGVNLVSFHLFFVSSTGSTELWRNFLLTQKNLEYCQFWCGSKQYPFYPLSAGIVRKNVDTLHTFAFYFQQLDNKPIDCSIFKEASNLHTILLKGSNLNVTDKMSTGILNFTMMPRSLSFIKILQIPMRKKDMSFIATKLPKLSRLYLEDIGEHNDLGLCLQDLCNLLQRKYSKDLKSIHLIRSLNRDSCEESSGDSNNNFDGYRIMAKILFKSQRYIGFQAELNDCGEFDIVQCDEEVDPLINDSEEVCPESETDNSWNVLYQKDCDKLACESSCESGAGPTQDECIQSEEIGYNKIDCVEEGFQIGLGDIHARTADDYVNVKYLDGNPDANYGFHSRYACRPHGGEQHYQNFYRNPPPPNHQEYYQQQYSPCVPQIPHSAPKARNRGFYCIEQEQDYHKYERHNTVPRYQQHPHPHPHPHHIHSNHKCNHRHSTNKNKLKIPETIHEHALEDHIENVDGDKLSSGSHSSPNLEGGSENTSGTGSGSTPS